MTLWFLRGLRRRIITTRYPAHPEQSAARLPTPPVFRADLMTDRMATELQAVCPSRALSVDDDVLIYDVGACTCCGRCYRVAGPAARPSGSVELAATAREQLVKRIPLIGREVK